MADLEKQAHRFVAGDRVRFKRGGRLGTIIQPLYPNWVDWRPDDYDGPEDGAMRTDPSNLELLASRAAQPSDAFQQALSFCYALLRPGVDANAIIAANPEHAAEAHRAIYEREPQAESYDAMMLRCGDVALAFRAAQPVEGEPKHQGCRIPPEGWWCSRERGHEGPCAARPISDLALAALEAWRNLPVEDRDGERPFIMGFNAGWDEAQCALRSVPEAQAKLGQMVQQLATKEAGYGMAYHARGVSGRAEVHLYGKRAEAVHWLMEHGLEALTTPPAGRPEKEARPDREEVKVLMPPSSEMSDDYQAGWIEGQRYLIANLPTDDGSREERMREDRMVPLREPGEGGWLAAAPSPDETVVERVATAIVEEIAWGSFSHIDPTDVRRIARAALAAINAGDGEGEGGSPDGNPRA